MLVSFISSFFYALLVSSHASMTSDSAQFTSIHVFTQLFFAFDLILQFFLEIPVDRSSSEFKRDIMEIGKTYIKGSFFIDLIALVPFTEILSQWEHKELLYLLKLLRLHNGFALLNYKVMVKELK